MRKKLYSSKSWILLVVAISLLTNSPAMAQNFTSAPESYKQYTYPEWFRDAKFGYKDIIPLWKAERWDPELLMALYKKVGAKYFVSMGTHHDNFFLWNSKIHDRDAGHPDAD